MRAALPFLFGLVACGSSSPSGSLFSGEDAAAGAADVGATDVDPPDLGAGDASTDASPKDVGVDDLGFPPEDVGVDDVGSADAGTPDIGPGQCHPTLAPCPPEEWCDDPLEACGVGTCKPAPFGCSGLYAPVCACDGQVYTNACEAHRSGLGSDAREQCMPPAPNLTACGVTFCNPERELCLRQPQTGGPDTWSCQPIPPSCAPPTCACLSPSVDCLVRECVSTSSGFRLACG